MECVHHKTETVIMVCTHCDKYPFVCAVCVEEDHAEHKLTSLRSAAHSIRQNLEQTQSDNVQVFEEIKSDLGDLAKIKEKLQQGGNLVDNEIVKHVCIIKSEVDAMKEDALQKHKMELGKNASLIKMTEEALKQQVAQIDTFQGKVAQLQKMNDYVNVIVTGREVEVPDTSRIPRPDLHALVFTPGTVSTGELSRMFGGISDVNEQGDTTGDDAGNDTYWSAEEEDDKSNGSSDFVGLIKIESNIKVTIVNSFKLSKPSKKKGDGINTMFCSKPGVCWLKGKDINSVKLSNRSGQIKKAINLGTRSDGFTVTSDNRLLFCCTAQQCIKEMELPNGEIIEKFSTSPLIPNRICTGPSGEIYVTLCDEDDYNVTENSTRVLIRYDRYGIEKVRSPSGFVLPADLCVNNSGTQVAVINHINYRYGELVVLDQELSPVLIYRGPSVLTDDSLAGFAVTGVMFDTRNNILVAECYSKTVQLLSPSCEPLKVLLSMDTFPWTMTIHGNEVWVGDGDGKVQIFRYSY